MLGVCNAAAATLTESGDAGLTLATAQQANTLPQGTILSAIDGFLDPTDADLFAIFLTGGMTFSATTDSALSNFFDTQLFLFDSLGFGIYANDDDDTSPPQSTLPASISFTPSVSGIYYLAISGSGFLPVSPGGLIFPSTLFPGLLDPGIVGPTGPGGGSPLSGWTGISSESGDYSIALTGAEFLPSAELPEPATIGMVGGAILVALVRRRSSRLPKS